MQSGGKTWEIRPSPAQNMSESQYSCIFQEPMNWSKYPYIVIRVKCTLDKNTPAFLKSHYLRARVANQTFPSSNPHATSRCTFQKFPHQPLLLHPNKLGWQRSGTVSWVLSDWLGAQHPLSSVIKLGIRHSRKKERKKKAAGRWQDSLFFFRLLLPRSPTNWHSHMLAFTLTLAIKLASIRQRILQPHF